MGGYAPERHQLSIDCVLLKKLNSWDVIDLRTICLLESEEKHNYRQLGIYVMWE